MVSAIVVSLIASIVALVGSVGSAGIAAWAIFYSAHRKQLTEVEKAMSMYRDPLLLAAFDLERKLWSIAEGKAFGPDEGTREERDYLYERTCFLVGQYFSWTHILRNETQFLRFSEEKRIQLHTKALGKISERFSQAGSTGNSDVFRLWTGEQEALGEEMTAVKGEQRFCIGYATFQTKLREGKFRVLLARVKRDIKDTILENREIGSSHRNQNRVWQLQHLLADLVDELDPNRLHHHGKARRKIVKGCDCKICGVESRLSRYSALARTITKRRVITRTVQVAANLPMPVATVRHTRIPGINQPPGYYDGYPRTADPYSGPKYYNSTRPRSAV